jgi:hypothetical protein
MHDPHTPTSLLKHSYGATGTPRSQSLHDTLHCSETHDMPAQCDISTAACSCVKRGAGHTDSLCVMNHDLSMSAATQEPAGGRIDSSQNTRNNIRVPHVIGFRTCVSPSDDDPPRWNHLRAPQHSQVARQREEHVPQYRANRQ